MDMSWEQVATLSQLKVEQRLVVEAQGKKILLLLKDDKVHATDAKCPHLGLSLAKAKINDNQELVCPFHKSAFDLCTGEVKCWSPWPKVIGGFLGKISKPKALEVFPVRIEEDKIMLEL
jgi:nitrite reductase/ring-hydroxylating ferredoxin subunit